MYGGVCFIVVNATWSASSDQFISNRALVEGGVVSNIDFYKSLSLSNCLAFDNFASVGSIMSLGTAIFGLNISNCKFESNFAFYYGGVVLKSSNLTIQASTFQNNRAHGSGAALFLLGAGKSDILYENETYVMIIDNCTFQNNSVKYAPRDFSPSYEGAAIFSSSVRALIINSSSFVGNKASSGGKGLDVFTCFFSLINGYLMYNFFSHLLGAIYSTRSSINIFSSIFRNNVAETYFNEAENRSFGGGGGAIFWMIDSSTVSADRRVSD